MSPLPFLVCKFSVYSFDIPAEPGYNDSISNQQEAFG